MQRNIDMKKDNKINNNWKRIRNIGTVLILVLLWTFIVVDAAQGMSVTLNVSKGEPGIPVMATGSSWQVGHTIHILWEEGSARKDIGKVVVNSNGKFSKTFIVPSTAGAGSHNVLFWDQNGQTFYPKVFTVIIKQYAAFAYAIAERVASVGSGTSQESAEADAETKCRKQGGKEDCQAVGWWRNGWGSFAIGANNQFGWGTDSSSINSADKWALNYCGSGCKLVIRVGVGGPSPWTWNSVTPVRGNWRIGGFSENVNNDPKNDHIGRDFWAVDFFSDALAVYPTRSGKVVFSGNSCKRADGLKYPCYGNVVAIDNGKGLNGKEIYSIYTHLAATGLPKNGSQVSTTTRIGTMSDSGCPASVCGSPVHLHYAMRTGPIGLSGEKVLYYGDKTNAVRSPWHIVGGTARSSQSANVGHGGGPNS
jgi:murein DD-endopeptidase MepM/ murein hydrolase activator NlpD